VHAVDTVPDDTETLKRLVLEREDVIRERDAQLTAARDELPVTTTLMQTLRREIAAKTPPVRRPLPDHLPLYRRAGICARQGVELERSTPADWVGASAKRLEPLVRALRDHAPAAGTLQADGYAGFERLYETGRSTEAACRAHVRHTFHDLEQAIGVIDSVDGLVLWPSVGTPTP
jgi:hypothetical protein